MTNPVAATLTQLKNIEARTGKTIAELQAEVMAEGVEKYGERRSWLMARFKLGHGDANAVVSFIGKPIPRLDGAPQPITGVAAAGDSLDAIYSGSKANLRPLHDLVMAKVGAFGSFEQAPKKRYISLRRKKQFAMIGPATKESIEIGLNAKNLSPHARLKLQPAGSMCNATTRITNADEVDKLLIEWLRLAFDAAA